MALGRIPEDKEDVVIDEAIDDAMNTLFAELQDAIGQNDGGVAAVFFAGEREEEVKKLLRPMMKAYLRTEYSYIEEE